MLSLSHDEVVHLKGSMYTKMPGTPEQKMANLRLAYAYQMVHPGKKLLFMGQEFGQEKEWNEKQSLSWELLEDKEHLQLKTIWRHFMHSTKQIRHCISLTKSRRALSGSMAWSGKRIF